MSNQRLVVQQTFNFFFIWYFSILTLLDQYPEKCINKGLEKNKKNFVLSISELVLQNNGQKAVNKQLLLY